MITSDWIIAIATSVYTLVTLITLLLIRRQLKDVNRNILSSTYQNIYELMIDIDKFFIENPNLKFYFYSGQHKQPRSIKEKQQLLSIAEMLVDFFDCVYYQRDCMRKETFEAKAFYFGDIYNKSHIIREYLSQPNLENWYSKEFLEFIKAEAIKAKSFTDKKLSK